MHAPLPSPTDIVDRGPRQVARSRTVSIDAAALYAALEDPRRHHELDGSGTVGAVLSGPYSLRTGDAFTVAMTLGPLRYRMTNRVVAAETGRLLAWRLPAGHSWRWELEPLGDGLTRVTEIFDYREAKVPWLLELLRFPDRNARGIEQTLAGLEGRFTSE